jgi:hypothetical protein
MKDRRKERTAHQEVTESNPEKRECVAMHEEFHMEDATVKSSRTKKKPRKGWHLAAG